VAVRGRPPKGVERSNVVLRIPKDLLERIKAHQASLEALAGVSIARHDVMLVLLQKGLEACAQPAPQASNGNTAYNGYTRSEGSAPARQHDGPRHAQARAPLGQRKLTPRQVRALRDKRHRGVSIEALMEEYAISRASVFRYLQSEKR
jgi:hypothetical protein